MKFIAFYAALLFSAVADAQTYRLISPEVIELGRVLEGKTIEGNIQFINTGKVPLRIERVQTSCGCTAAEMDRMEFQPKDTASIHFTLRTSSFRGVVRKALTVFFENGSPDIQTFFIQALVYSELEMKPSYISFPAVPLHQDTVMSAAVRILNQSKKPVRIQTIRSESDQIQVVFEPCVIPPEQESAFQILLKPKTTGYRTSQVVVQSDCPSKPQISVPVIFEIFE